MCVIECLKSKIQSVGEPKMCFTYAHCYGIKHHCLERSVGRSLEDLMIFVIEKIHIDDTNFQRLKESFWIQTPDHKQASNPVVEQKH